MRPVVGFGRDAVIRRYGRKSVIVQLPTGATGGFMSGVSSSKVGGAGGNITIHAGADVTANGGSSGKHGSGGHGGSTAITTPNHNAGQGDPGIIDDRRNLTGMPFHE